MTAKARIVAGGAALVVGVWLFLFPFIAPSAGMPLYAASSRTATSSGSSMSGMNNTKSSNSSMSGMNNTKSSNSSMSGMNNTKSSSSSMSGMNGAAKSGGSSTGSSLSSAIVINHATVVVNLIPGILVAVFGVYLLAGAFDRRQQAMVLQ